MVLGRSAGLTDEQLAHMLDDPLPAGLFEPDEEAILRYARALAAMEPITDELYAGLTEHFDVKQILELCFVVGISQMVSRFHATVQTDVDEDTLEELVVACPVRLPRPPA